MVSLLEVALKVYFLNIFTLLYSIMEGMAVTASYLFRRPVTIQYPDKISEPMEDMLADRFRGALQVDTRYCIGCRICEKTCPIECIAIDIEKNVETKEKKITLFNIDLAKCMYCGLCSEGCSTNAIYHTKVFNTITCNVDDLVISFVEEPMALYKLTKGYNKNDTPMDLNGAIILSKLRID
jgi:NAD(P)H-quinone oxidoreductase subunit I